MVTKRTPSQRARPRMLLAALTAFAFLLPAVAQASPLSLVGDRALDARLHELTLSTPALPAPTHVRVLLPDGYDASGATRYPVLYLLHGGNGSFADWTTAGLGDARAATAGLGVIVIMPDAGKGGWYTDWYKPGLQGQPKWESYHVNELIPFVDARYATVARRSGRAIAGLSMGGFGAMSYAARHPDRFAAASSWSGAVNTNNPPEVAGHVIDLIAGSDGGLPGSLFGLRETEEVRWRGHNPWDLAGNLRDMTLAIRTGNGQAGGTYGGGPVDPLETLVHPMGVDLHDQLASLGVAHVFDDYGPGAHAWPYWNRDLREDLPAIMATFARDAAPPARISYRSIERDYSVFGWHVALRRHAVEFSALERAQRSGFTLSGSGNATVTTPARYTPRTRYRVRVGRAVERIRADARGRLRIHVPLGAANLVQEYAVPVVGFPRQTYRTAVGIRRAGG